MTAAAPPLARRSQAKPFHEFPPAVHLDAYVPFLQAAELVGLRGLCANAANAATARLRGEAVPRVVARSAMVADYNVPALAAVRDTTPAALADEAVVAACDAELHLPIDVGRVLATAARDMQVVVWPHSSPMAGPVKRALEYDGGFGSTACMWALVPSDAGSDSAGDAMPPEARLERRLQEWGVVAVRRDALAAFGVDARGGCSTVETLREALQRLFTSWHQASTTQVTMFTVTGQRTLALDVRGHSASADKNDEAPPLDNRVDTVLFATPPSPLAYHVIGSVRDRGVLLWPPTSVAATVRTVDLSACRDLHTIGDKAFHRCAALENVVFPPGIKRLDERVLSECPRLGSVDLSSCHSLCEIGRFAFSACATLKSVWFPPGLTRFGGGVLSLCPKLAAVDLSACRGLRSIASSAFERCDALERIAFPPNIQSLGWFVLCECPKLVTMDLSACQGLCSIERQTFRGCSSLETVVFPPNVETVQDEVLAHCSKLVKVNFGACRSLRRLGESVLSDCASLTTVVFPPGLEFLNLHGLANCSKLVSIDLRAYRSMRNLEKGALSGCALLETVVFPPGLVLLGESVLSECPKLAGVDLSACDGLRTVDDDALSRCATLRMALFPPSLEKVGMRAFAECPMLAAVDLRACAALRSIGDGAFGSSGTLDERVVLPPGFTQQTATPDQAATTGCCACM